MSDRALRLVLAAVAAASVFGASKQPVDPRAEARDEARAEGSRLLTEGRYDEAVAALDRAIRFGADEARDHLRLAEAQRLRGNPSSAMTAYRGAILRDGSLTAAHVGLALAAIASANVTLAESELDKALRLDPRDVTARRLAGDLRARRGDAIGAYAQYIEAAASGDIASALGAADAAKTLGRWEEALLWLDRAVEASPEDVRLLFQLGLSKQTLGYDEAALDEYEAALRENPRHFEALYNVAVVHENAERPDSAVAYYRLAAQARPKDPRPHLQIASLEQRRGRVLEAMQSYEAFLRLVNDPAVREEIRRVLEDLREEVRAPDPPRP